MSEETFPDDIPEQLPRFYGSLEQFFAEHAESPDLPFRMRIETMCRIEKETGRPLLCYVTDTNSVDAGASIEDRDVIGFEDLVDSVEGNVADIFLVSNGGSPEAAERIVSRLRDRFKCLRFIIPYNAFSAATLMCFSGDRVLMLPEGTLGPIDPQIGAVPARAILRAFENLEKRLAEEGPKALPAYLPLLQKYDLHLLEQCRNAQRLSEELARKWLRSHAMRAKADNVDKAVEFFANWDHHKSHGRSIGPESAKEQGMPIERLSGKLESDVRSLHHQYVFFFFKTPFLKVFENAHGVAWGSQQEATFSLPIPVLGPIGPAGD